MNIAFYALQSGLNNNGGTNTIVGTVKALRALGHNAFIISIVDNYTMEDHPQCISVPAPADVVVGVSYMDIERMHCDYPNTPKCWWMRLWDSDKIQDAEIHALANAQPVITNAHWIRQRLLQVGCHAVLLRQGIDDEFWVPDASKRNGHVIGTCFRPEPRKRYYDFALLKDYMSKNDGLKFDSVIGLDKVRLRDWYQSIEFYISPSRMEGCPNAVIEAALCGCKIIARRNPEAGVIELLSEKQAYLYDDIAEVPKMLQYEIDNTGVRERLISLCGTKTNCALKMLSFLQEVINTYDEI